MDGVRIYGEVAKINCDEKILPARRVDALATSPTRHKGFRLVEEVLTWGLFITFDQENTN